MRPAPDVPARLAPLLTILGLFAITLLAYLPAMRSGGFIWDDDDYVTRNRAVLRGDLAAIWTPPWRLEGALPRFDPDRLATPQYYPMTFTSLALERSLWGSRPTGFHVTNVLLHATAASLVWVILRRLKIPGALLAAAVFAVHPVHAESVAWITERKNTLSGVLYLASLLACLEYAGERRSVLLYVAALALFVLALLSKSVTATLPAAALLLIWYRRGTLSWRDAVVLLPFFALGALAGAQTGLIERTVVGASGPDFAFSLADRVLIAGRAPWFYAGKLLVPYPLTFIYPRWHVDPAALWQWVFPVATLAALIAAFAWSRRIGRGPAAALAFFLLTLAPALGFVNVYPMLFSFVADHFQYLASLGPIVLVSAALAARRMPVGWVGGAVGVAVLGALTMLQCRIYAGPAALWTDTLAKNPDAWIAHENLAIERLAVAQSADDVTQAIDGLTRAIALKPGRATAYSNLGNAYLQRGDVDRALATYQEGLARAPSPDPHRAQLHNGMGSALGMRWAATRDPELLRAAHRAFLQAVALDPHLAAARGNLAMSHLLTGDKPAARAEAVEALRLDPANTRARQVMEQTQ